MKLTTVEIGTKNGCVTINESDFDKKIHTLWKNKEVKKVEKSKKKKGKNGAK